MSSLPHFNPGTANNQVLLPTRLLTLDGGGSKGMYTLGLLSELELALKQPLCSIFNLMYGTSTGAIIASLLALGRSASDITTLYREHIPRVMNARDGEGKSAELAKLAADAFGDLKSDAFKTHVGLVAVNWERERPLVFKTDLSMAHGMKSSFEPFFGATIADAVIASCAAFPVFDRKEVSTSNQGIVDLGDGGFAANNPTLFALVDAMGPLHATLETLSVLSVGCGNYPQRKPGFFKRWATGWNHVQLLIKLLAISANTNELLVKLLYPSLAMVRVNETFSKPQLATDFVESDPDKLELMFQEGRESFGRQEEQILKLFHTGDR